MKSLKLVKCLTEKELSLLRKKKAFQRGRSYDQLVKLMLKADERNQEVDKKMLSKVILGEKYKPEHDNRIRSVLSRFNSVIENFLVEQQVLKRIQENKSKYNQHLLESLKERNETELFESTYKQAIDHARKNQHLQEAIEIQKTMIYQQTDGLPITKELLKDLNQQASDTMHLAKQAALKTIHQVQGITAFLKGAGLPYEDQASKKDFDIVTSLNLLDESLLNPYIEYDYLQTLYFLTTDRKEKMDLLHQKIELLEQCQFEDYPYARNLSASLLNLAVQYIYSRDYNTALELIQRTVQVLESNGLHCHFRLIHSAMICYNLLNRYAEAIEFYNKYSPEITEPNTKLHLQMDVAYAYLHEKEVEKVRKFFEPNKLDTGAMVIAKKSGIILCLIEEGEYLIAQNACANLMVLINNRAKQGSFGYWKESLNLISDMIKVLLLPPNSRDKQLEKLRLHYNQLANTDDLSVTEMGSLNWIHQKLGEL